MKLSEWARENGLSYRTAHRLFKAGNLPCKATQLATGTILVYAEEDPKTKAVALYGRVSSHDQSNDLKRQMKRLRDFSSVKGMYVVDEREEIGSGLNGHRKKLLSLLGNKNIHAIVVEHRDRLARFGVEYIEAALAATGRELIVMNETEEKDDLIQDFVDVVTSMCSRIYGKRSASNRAKRALKAANEIK